MGAGVFGAFHAAKYAACQQASLTAVYDIDFERAQHLAHIYGASPYKDYVAFLNAVDALTVAAPAGKHFELASQALAAGKHVLVEKPIALSLEDADGLIELAREGGLVLQAGHQERYIVDTLGIFGRKDRLTLIECRRCGPESGRGEDVSVVYDLMIHDLDLIRRLTPDEPASVRARTIQGQATLAHEVEAKMCFESGLRVECVASRRAPQRERVMRLSYEDGVIEIDFVARRILNTTPSPVVWGFDDIGQPLSISDPLRYGVKQFLETVQTNGTPPVTGEQARDALNWAIMIDSAAGAVEAKAADIQVSA